MTAPRRCDLCEHLAHEGRCSWSDPVRCACMESIQLEPIALALWTIRMHMPRWELRHLTVIAQELNCVIPDYPTVTQRRLGIKP